MRMKNQKIEKSPRIWFMDIGRRDSMFSGFRMGAENMKTSLDIGGHTIDRLTWLFIRK